MATGKILMLLAAQKNKKQVEKWTKLNYDKNIISRNNPCHMSSLRMPASGHTAATTFFCRFFIYPAFKKIHSYIRLLF